MDKPQYILGQKEIMEFLPHRAPFLLVDKILEISGPHPLDDNELKHKVGIKVIGVKNVTVSEPHFQGHFPQMPVTPGVLIVETMAQTASFALYPAFISRLRQGETLQCLLVGVDKARFRAPVVPGDSMRIEIEVTGCRTSIWAFEGKAYVDGKLVAEASLMANMGMTPKVGA
ncbi:MAG: 3-hydroxyacyl-ACP dehydratase FabZ [Bdellovibrionales bacterium]|nr:3-hydroxyacyl-ACP dehydratase FabZ [Bdellovibrionales bacterium]